MQEQPKPNTPSRKQNLYKTSPNAQPSKRALPRFGKEGFHYPYSKETRIIKRNGSMITTVPLQDRFTLGMTETHYVAYVSQYAAEKALIQPTSIISLTRALKEKIFRLLADQDDYCTATCLGLTCREFLYCYRVFFKGQLDLQRSLPADASLTDQTHKPTQLATLLQDFMGPEYRLARWHYGLFLSREAYGDTRDIREGMLEERWQDYWAFPLPVGLKKAYGFPCPNDKKLGVDMWYEKAEKMVRDWIADGQPCLGGEKDLMDSFTYRNMLRTYTGEAAMGPRCG